VIIFWVIFLARINPDIDIYLLLATDQQQVELNHTELLDILHSYGNIRIRYFNIDEYTKGTKLEQFFKDNPVKNSPHRIEHTSDVLRILTLNKFGGLYLDLDVLSLFPIRLIKNKNFGCLEHDDGLANAIVKLDRVEGKKYSDRFLE
jgi:lactosylceramide 4-alpha-galactosyltransferase